jgi:predicted ATP-grasp superfamily ATP-dependent carboligase
MEDPEAFVGGVLRKLREWKVDVLLPMTEKSLRALLPLGEDLGAVRVPFPDSNTFCRVSDKSTVLSAAARIGMAVPGQWEFESAEGLLGAGIPDSGFPLVLKPTRSVSSLGTGGRQVGIRYVSDDDDLQAWCASSGASHFPVLAQRRILGSGTGVFVLTWGGELKAVVGHTRIREKPPSGGVSVVRESTLVDQNLLDQTLALLQELEWGDGVAMVEYKVEQGTGVPYLMEINGRFWGSLQLAIDAGVDFPSLLLDCARGSPPEDLVVGKEGIRTRWLMGDLDQLLVRLRRRRDKLNLPTSFPGRMKGVLDFLVDFRPGVRTEILKVTDLMPFVAEVQTWINDVVRGR